jgi:lipopolysaccharide transport system ATP-binding protein
MSTVISVENLSKAYQLGQFSTGTISKDLERWWALSRGKEDPFLKIGETNLRSTKGTTNIVWSLKDLNFDIQQGEAIGIIGKNGAGKSTLLKILSQVTSPTTGKIKIKGKIASLLEVGTGFHPELSGRENIYLNGAILGMKKSEINKQFDEIVDFSGVERYIDTPVKRYSSGMYVRLAFAVAAHLQSEILIVDEVLAVGDADFQKKCLGKMGDISAGNGRTVLFVSHNMSSIKSLCPKSILLGNGQMIGMDSSDKIIDKYLDSNHDIELSKIKITEANDRRGSGKARFTKIEGFENKHDFNNKIQLNFEIDKLEYKRDIFIKLRFKSPKSNEYIFSTPKYKINKLNFNITIEQGQIFPGDYQAYIWLSEQNEDALDLIENIYVLRVVAHPDNLYEFDPGKIDSYILLQSTYK